MMLARRRLRHIGNPQGFGSHVTGGAGGTVMNVTSLADSGAGTLRAALMSTERREIRLMVAGLCTVSTRIVPTRGDFTLRGDLAPGNGFCLRAANNFDGGHLMCADIENFVLEHVRLRPGASNVAGGTGARDGLTVVRCRNFRLRHISESWANDGGIDITDDCSDFSIERCLIAKNLWYSNHEKGTHSTGMLLSTAQRATIRENVFAFNNGRNPFIQSQSGLEGSTRQIEFINNLVYGWGEEACALGSYLLGVNLIGNYFEKGADFPTDNDPVDSAPAGGTMVSAGFYLLDNRDATLRTSDAAPEAAIFPEASGQTWLTATPFSGSGNISARRAMELEDALLPVVGATLPARDAIDVSIVNQIAGRTGQIINAVESGEVTVGLGSQAPPGEEPRDTPSMEQDVPNPWGSW